jgi:hypothetical protein
MNSLMELISNPLVWKIVISYYVFSAAVGALPTPDSGGNKFYQFAFRFAHILAGNLSRAAVKFQVPGAQVEPEKP